MYANNTGSLSGTPTFTYAMARLEVHPKAHMASTTKARGAKGWKRIVPADLLAELLEGFGAVDPASTTCALGAPANDAVQPLVAAASESSPTPATSTSAPPRRVPQRLQQAAEARAQESILFEQASAALDGVAFDPDNPAAYRQPANGGDLLARLNADAPQAPAAVQPAVQFQSSAATGKRSVDALSFELLKHISQDFVVLTRKQRLFYHVESGDELGAESFLDFCAGHYGAVTTYDDKGAETHVNAGEAWIKSRRGDMGKRVVRRIVMEPTCLPEHEDPCGPQVFNRWHVLKHSMVEPNLAATPEDCAPLFEHLMYISDGDTEGVAYFLNWLAQLYQHPDSKVPAAIMLYSKHSGVGKSRLHKLLSAIFGPPLCLSTNGKALNKQFMDPWKDKRLIMLNELARSDRLDSYEWFKNLISEESVTLDSKGKTEVEVRNFWHFILTTNNPDALPLMDGDRRVLVLRCESPRRDDAYYTRFDAWMTGRGPALVAGMLAAWRFPEGWNPYAPVPQTAAVKAAQAAARSPLVQWLEELIAERAPPFDKDLVRTGSVIEQLGARYPQQTRAHRLNTTTIGNAWKALGFVNLKSGTASMASYWCRPDRADYWNAQGPTAWKKYYETLGAAVGDQPAPALSEPAGDSPAETRH